MHAIRKKRKNKYHSFHSVHSFHSFHLHTQIIVLHHSLMSCRVWLPQFSFMPLLHGLYAFDIRLHQTPMHNPHRTHLDLWIVRCWQSCNNKAWAPKKTEPYFSTPLESSTVTKPTLSNFCITVLSSTFISTPMYMKKCDFFSLRAQWYWIHWSRSDGSKCEKIGAVQNAMSILSFPLMYFPFASTSQSRGRSWCTNREEVTPSKWGNKKGKTTTSHHTPNHSLLIKNDANIYHLPLATGSTSLWLFRRCGPSCLNFGKSQWVIRNICHISLLCHFITSYHYMVHR